MVRKKKAKSKGKQMRRKMIFGKKKAMDNSFILRTPASLFGNDEEEKEEGKEEDEGEEKDKNEDEEHDEEEEDEEEKEEDEERKGWSD